MILRDRSQSVNRPVYPAVAEPLYWRAGKENTPARPGGTPADGISERMQNMNSPAYNNIRIAAIGSAVLLISSCAQVDSDVLRTAGIHADIRVEATGTGSTNIVVDLTVGSGITATQVDLASSDVLTATAGGQVQTFSQKEDITGDLEYRASFPFDTADTLLTVSLDRLDDVDAPNSYVTLATPITITAPTNGASFGASSNMDVTWNAVQTVNGTIGFYIDVSCPTTVGTSSASWGSSRIPDDGIESVSITNLVNQATANGNYPLTGNCNGAVHLVRTNTGSIDSHLGGGSISATYEQTIGFVISNS